MLFAYFDEAGRVVSAYNDDTVTEVPDGAYVISIDQFENRFDLRLENGNFISDPLPPVTPTSGEIVLVNTAMRDGLLYSASSLIAPLQDAVDLDIATDGEKASLVSWKKYRVDVNRVDLATLAPVWPTRPDA